MSMPQWSMKDTLGHDQIDGEHQRLLELLGWLEDELYLEHDLALDQITHLVDELNSHVAEHFQNEEDLMENLPGMPAQERMDHAKDHERWRKRIHGHLAPLLSAPTELERRAHLARILIDGKAFWQEHFHVYDRTLGTYLGAPQ